MLRDVSGVVMADQVHDRKPIDDMDTPQAAAARRT
jgi:hypothetical protein